MALHATMLGKCATTWTQPSQTGALVVLGRSVGPLVVQI
nr:unnamed protein product [Callosobruchus chinensis]